MPVTWWIEDWALVVMLSGDYAFGDMREAFEKAFIHPRFRAGLSLLVEARGSLTELAPHEVNRRSDFFASLHGRGLSGRYAFVLRTEPRALLDLAMTQLREKGVNAQAFPDTESARLWLTSG